MHLRWAFGVGVFCIGLGFGTRIFTQKPHSIHIAVSGLKLSLPATWRITRNPANPILVTASGMHDLQPTFTVGTTRNPYVAVLRSADGGRRWGAMSPRLSVNPRDFWSVQTVGGTVAIAIASGRLWTSTNGARSWAYRSADAFLNHVTGLDFVNAQVGWVWKTTANGTRWWMTTSGGRQWTTWGSTLWQPNDGARH